MNGEWSWDDSEVGWPRHKKCLGGIAIGMPVMLGKKSDEVGVLFNTSSEQAGIHGRACVNPLESAFLHITSNIRSDRIHITIWLSNHNWLAVFVRLKGDFYTILRAIFF